MTRWYLLCKVIRAVPSVEAYALRIDLAWGRCKTKHCTFIFFPPVISAQISLLVNFSNSRFPQQYAPRSSASRMASVSDIGRCHVSSASLVIRPLLAMSTDGAGLCLVKTRSYAYIVTRPHSPICQRASSSADCVETAPQARLMFNAAIVSLTKPGHRCTGTMRVANLARLLTQSSSEPMHSNLILKDCMQNGFRTTHPTSPTCLAPSRLPCIRPRSVVLVEGYRNSVSDLPLY